MDKVVLVTGAAAGMGRSVALKYAELNAKISIVDIDAKGLNETAQDCAKYNDGNVLHTVMDLSNDKDLKTVVDNTIKKFGKIDILVNCAGIIGNSNILDENLMQKYDKIMAVNLRSMVHLTNLCAPYLIKSKGCIVNIASLAAILTGINYLVYNISKAGVDHFTRCCALELASHGVRANAILPGMVASKLYINSGMTEEESDMLIKTVAAGNPLKHATTPDEIADLVLFLTSDKARSITGASYTIDAGSKLTGF